jgi:hypothetical protein
MFTIHIQLNSSSHLRLKRLPREQSKPDNLAPALALGLDHHLLPRGTTPIIPLVRSRAPLPCSQPNRAESKETSAFIPTSCALSGQGRGGSHRRVRRRGRRRQWHVARSGGEGRQSARMGRHIHRFFRAQVSRIKNG